jgi:hypothetical protein
VPAWGQCNDYYFRRFPPPFGKIVFVENALKMHFKVEIDIFIGENISRIIAFVPVGLLIEGLFWQIG